MTKLKIKNKHKLQITNYKTLILIFVIWNLNLFYHLPACRTGRDFIICHSLAFAQDKIIAIVNDDIITQKDFDDFLAFMRMQLSQELKGKQLEDKIAAMKPDFIQRLVEDKVILQEAKKVKFTIDPGRLKERISNIKKQYPSDVAFQEALRQQGLVQADIEAKIKDQMFMFAIIDNKIRSKVVVSPAEVTAYYQGNPQVFKSAQTWEFDFLVLEDSNAAKEVSQSLKQGETLESLAAKFGFSVNKLSMKPGQFKKDVEDVLLKLNPGNTTEPLKIENKYYIFRLSRIIPPRQLSLSEAQENIYSYLYNKKVQERLEKWLDELKKQSYIKILEQ